MKVTNELKTGLIVVAAIAVAAIFWLKTTNFSDRPYRLKTQFNYAEGLKADSVVKLSGIEIGRIEDIRFIYSPETKVELVLLLDKDAKIHEDSIAYISSSGIVGDAFLGLTPGSPDKPFAKDGDTVSSEDPVEMRKIMRQVDTIAGSLDKTLEDFRELTSNVNGVVKDNRTKIDSLLVNLEQTAVNFKEFSEDIKKNPWKLLSKK
ncbi:MAG: MlaD family protein [Candidatus Omnitrophota bacterium]|jgi:phospholipid/cholesterol/gamma-HCH transport system substrate-binding protein|nr:MlaD family protein [Candidatus Omnitrophota bacterium]